MNQSGYSVKNWTDMNGKNSANEANFIALLFDLGKIINRRNSLNLRYSITEKIFLQLFNTFD